MRAPLRMPWSGRDMPHAVLDILRGCNIRCPGCYNRRPPQVKELSELERELDELLRRRRPHVVSLSGGEVTLHPHLPELVRMIRNRGLHAALVTNGTRLEDGLLRELRQAGLELLMVHVQHEQERPDLPPRPTAADARRLRQELAARIAAHGLDAGYSHILYRHSVADVPDLLQEILESEHVSHVLLTEYGDFDRVGPLYGDAIGGMRSARPAGERPPPDEPRPAAVLEPEFARAGLRPFSFVCSNRDENERRWLSFNLAVVRFADGRFEWTSLQPGASDRFFLRLIRRCTGRYPFYFRSGGWRLRAQLFLNACTGGHARDNARVLRASFRRGAVLRDKHVVFQRAPELDANGRLVFCRDCPDATVRGGRLVPSCLSDLVIVENEKERTP